MLSDGSVRELEAGGCVKVDYDNRLEYLAAMKQARLREFDKQIAALQKGLLSVVPQVVVLDDGFCLVSS